MKAEVAKARVFTPSNREMLVEEWAALATARIMSVSDHAPPLIRDQAHAFRDQIERLIAHYMREAVRSDRYQLMRNLAMTGNQDMASVVLEH